MCAIVDANVAGSVFGEKCNSTDAAREFRARVDAGKMTLVVGGKLRRDLAQYANFKTWYSQASRFGMARSVPDSDVDYETLGLVDSCKSNDPHLLALARVSGARLLFTDDQELMEDFKNAALINGPIGKIYKTPKDGKFTDHHRRLLNRNVCNA